MADPIDAGFYINAYWYHTLAEGASSVGVVLKVLCVLASTTENYLSPNSLYIYIQSSS